ncbi:MAG TPA: type VI secretion system membrane subunit TssM [Blastocatellia bacterium]|nr:type VI secretion system membrane subunit TssM [Blastocatellia bacterium]
MMALSNRLKSTIRISALAALTLIAIGLVLVASNDPIVRVILIASVLLCWPIGFLIIQHRQHRRKREASPPDRKESAEVQPDRPRRVHKHLESGAAEIVDFLRQHRRGVGPGGDAVYSLPWFLIVGPPSSGKSSLMLSAGLSFTALKSQRHADLDLLRPTAHCDWRVTDQAVLIDSAGRYQTEGAERAEGAEGAEGNAESGGLDRDEWLGLIETLKRYRRQRPLDGLIVAVNGAKLLALPTSAEVEQQGRILRARLNELISGLAMQFPIYLVFTHIDRIPGFTDFFGRLETEDRSGAWGATIPLNQKDRAHALFETEFDHLVDSLLSRRVPRLGAVGTAGEQLGVFDFPIHFSAARQKFGAFTTALFSPNPFTALPRLRGVYFTGRPPGPPGRAEEGAAVETHLRTRGCFTEGLFKQVLRSDAHVAAAWQLIERRPNRVRKLAIAAASLAALSLLLLIGMLVSYANNRRLIADGQRAGSDLLRHFKPAGGGPAAPLTPIEAEDLTRLQDVLLNLDDHDRRWFSPLSHRFGLYPGRRLRPRLREIYFDFVTQRVLDPALAELARDLRQKSPALLPEAKQDQIDAAEQAYYDRLKAYLMVERRERIEPVFLQQQLAFESEDGRPGEGLPAMERRHLAYYVEQAGDDGDDAQEVPRPQTNLATVTGAREKLRNYAAAKQIYNEILSRVERQGEPYRLRDAVGSQQGSLWFEELGSLSVPYVFTKEAYYRHVKGEAWLAAFAEVRDKSQNDWVLQRTFDYQRVQPNDLRQRYERDYLTAWRKFLGGVRVKEFRKQVDAIEALDSLSQQNSPFTTIIDQVRNQTTLSEPPVTGGLIAWLKGSLTSKEKAPTEVEKAFAALKSFKLEGYLEKLKEVRLRLSDQPGDEWRQAAALAGDERYKRAREEARSLLKPLRANPGSDSVGTLLAGPLDNLELALGLGVEKDRDAAWNRLYLMAQALEERYPFRSGSSAEVQPAELADYLNRLTQFFDQHLKIRFEPATGTYLPLRRGEFSDEFVAYLNRLFGLREALAIRPPAGQPRFAYGITLQPPPGQTFEIRIDGQAVKAEGALQTASFNWPPSGQISGVEIGAIRNGQFNRIQSYGGAWGIFRMVMELRGSPPPYRFASGGARVTLQPPGGGNSPFIDFTQLRAPRNIGRPR